MRFPTDERAEPARPHGRHRERRLKAIWALCALLALNAFLLAAGTGFALPRPMAHYVFGPKVVRAEVIVKDGPTLHDFRIDRGRVRAVGDGSLTLLEADGALVTIPVATGAQITLGAGRPIPLSAVRRGMRAETVRDGDAPATIVRLQRR